MVTTLNWQEFNRNCMTSLHMTMTQIHVIFGNKPISFDMIR